MMKFKKIVCVLTFCIIVFTYQNAKAQSENLNSQLPPTPSDLIDAVNDLRIANGLRPLKEHQVLMQIAQIEVEGVAAGNFGHWRPNNISLGQWLISLGYPLAGDLSLDGYRSENFTAGVDLRVQGVIRKWSEDEAHLNTMLSPYRTDIGVGISTSVDEVGQTVYFYVLETALQTQDNLMQSKAYPTLTAIAMNQGGMYGDATQAALSLQVSQYIIPVVRATARPDGDVIHEVRNGQSLWSIAIEYGVKIDQIRQLNNLPSIDIYLGQKLLVQKNATQQPTPTPAMTATPTVEMSKTQELNLSTITTTPYPNEEHIAQEKRPNNLSFGVMAILLFGGLFFVFAKKMLNGIR
ncbi:MAG: hypothetical protein CVU42_16435 [Chloroflexi bacterium HGW-Chloroflexi-4]|jgi:LysM repeat protein|nr:MAG: hypothetical protein CVU42_16435 [Chloroflexi bacterium HGW-Chloroflexi-4]